MMGTWEEEEEEEEEEELQDTVLKGIPQKEKPVLQQLPVHCLMVQRAVRDHVLWGVGLQWE